MFKTLNQKNTKNPFKLVPWWGWVWSLIYIFILHFGFYFLSRGIVSNLNNSWWWYSPKIDSLDNQIPFVPYFFIQIYFLSYFIWFIAAIIASVGGKRNYINFMFYSLVSSFIGFLLFIIAPSRQDRVAEGLFEKIEEIRTPFTKWLMAGAVGNDGGKVAWNMAPSFHVLFSFLSSVCLFKQKNIHCSIRIIDYVLNVLIILSTVFVKQHYVVDVLFALSLGGVIYIIIWAIDPATLILSKHPNFLTTKTKK